MNVAITFDGSGSRDTDGTIVAYFWTFGDGGQSTVPTPTVSHAYAAVGAYTLTLWVQDDDGAWSGADTAVVTIGTTTSTTVATTTTSPSTTSTSTSTSTTRPSTTSSPTASTTTSTTRPNQPPHANAGLDQVVLQSVAAMLNGSGSTDADGTITTYTWNFGDGSGGSGMSMQHAYATPGTYAATLTVTDNLGATNSDTATVSVVDGTWVRAIGGASSDSGMAVAVDAGGNVVTGGAFYDAMTVGSTLLTSAGNSDVFLVKYSQTGSVLWARRLGGTGDDSVQSLAIDPTSGDVVMAGWFTGTTTIDTTSFVANGPQDILLAKFDGATGALRWAKQFGGIYEDVGNGVAVDTSGNILLTGSIKNRVTFGGAFLQTPQVTDTDVFVAKFTSAGAHVWSENFTNTAGDEGTTIAVDRNGYIVVGGWFTGSLYFGTTQLFAAHGMPDGFVARLDPAGTPTWCRLIGAGTPDDYDLVYGVAMDTGGNMLVTGRVGGAVDFGGGALSSLGAADAFVAKYGPTGAHVWSRRMGGISPDYGYGVAVDASNNVLVTGVFHGTADFGGVVLMAPGTGFNAFLAKYAAAGGTVWARQFGSTGDDLGHAVAVAPTGHPLVAGQFNGPTTFDGIPLSGVGLADAFLYHGKP